MPSPLKTILLKPALQIIAPLALAGAWLGAAVAAEALTDAPKFEPTPLIEPQSDRPKQSLETPNLAPSLARPESVEAEDSPTQHLLADVRTSHRWARFEPGAWRKVRIISETFDAEGGVADHVTIDRIERLVAVDDDTYTLEVDSIVPLAGRPAPGLAESRRLWILTDRSIALGTPEAQPGESTSISLGDVVLPCQTWRIETPAQGALEVETLSIAAGAAPSVLRREVHSTVGGNPGPVQTHSVTRLDLPIVFDGALRSTWQVASTIRRPDGSRTEQSTVCSAEVPGGVHWESTTVYDGDGQRDRWSVAQLVESGRTAEERIEAPTGAEPPAVSIEIPSRRMMRVLRREERRTAP